MEEAEVPLERLHEQTHEMAKHSGERWISWVALSTAILAVLAAIASLLSGGHANEAMMSQIEAADQWSYYQSKSIKEAQLKSKMDILEALGKPAPEADQHKALQYQNDKEKIESKARELEKEARHHLHMHHQLARSVTMFQIAIATGAISALTKRRKFWFVSLGFGGVGLFYVIQAFVAILGH